MVDQPQLRVLNPRYETADAVNKYLLFHYGREQDQLPFVFGPHDSLDFPVRCVKECVHIRSLPQHAKALEVGCAVGRSSFELSRFCERVLAVDASHAFIHTAKQMQREGRIHYILLEEDSKKATRVAQMPKGVHPERVEFRQCDAMNISSDLAPFDIVLVANVLCRLHNPIAFLKLLSHLVAPKGQLIIGSPYTWLEEFTPRENWLSNGKCPLEYMKEALGDHFDFQRAFDLPFLMREHYRKFEWGVAQMTIWSKKI